MSEQQVPLHISKHRQVYVLHTSRLFSWNMQSTCGV